MNIIFRESFSNVRIMARNALKGNWPAVVMAMMIYSILTSTLPSIISDFIPNAVISLKSIYPGSYLELYNQGLTDFSFVTTLYDFLLTGPFSLGLSLYLLKFLRTREMKIETLFEGFEFLIKAFLLQFMIYVFIVLWGMLFIIPGIIAGFRYSQAFFILADNPKKKVMECITESKIMMKNNKWSLFVLQLTFIGWIILAEIVTTLLLIPFSLGDSLVSTIILEVVAIFASIPIFMVSAYQNVATAIFYEIVSGHLVQKQPQEPNFAGNGYSDSNYRNDYNENNNNSGSDFYNRDNNRNNFYKPEEPKYNNNSEYEHQVFTYIPDSDKKDDENNN